KVINNLKENKVINNLKENKVINNLKENKVINNLKLLKSIILENKMEFSKFSNIIHTAKKFILTNIVKNNPKYQPSNLKYMKIINPGNILTQIEIYDKSRLNDNINKLKIMLGDFVCPNYKFKNNLLAIHYAALYNNFKIINFKFSRQFYNITGGKYKSTPLFFATYNKNYKLILYLLNNGAKITNNKKNISVIDVCIFENDIFGLLIYVFYVIKNYNSFLKNEFIKVYKKLPNMEYLGSKGKIQKYNQNLFIKKIIKNILDIAAYFYKFKKLSSILGNIKKKKNSGKVKYLIRTEMNNIYISNNLIKINNKILIYRKKQIQYNVLLYLGFIFVYLLFKNLFFNVVYCSVFYKYLIKTDFFFHLTCAFNLYLVFYDFKYAPFSIIMIFYLKNNNSFKKKCEIDGAFEIISNTVSPSFEKKFTNKFSENFCYTCWIEKNKRTEIKDNNFKVNNFKVNNLTDNNLTDNNLTDNNLTDNNLTDNNFTDNNFKVNNFKVNNFTESYLLKNAHHCSLCNKCFINSHHHCIFLSSCIEKKKLPFFAIYMLYIIYLTFILETNSSFLLQTFVFIRLSCFIFLLSILIE
ncbi:Palmitoyltransferase PFA3, partial [Dictyocoela muelleri]